MRISTLLLAFFTLVAFAANSILCRLAMMSGSIGPIEFTFIRLASGTIALLPLIIFRKHWFRRELTESSGGQDLLKIRLSGFWPAIALFGYALSFSLAYVQLDAGVGALILFASVQMTMMGVSMIQGNKVTPPEWAGFVISFAGLIYLLLPGLSAPPALGTILMIVSGVSWGMYSLLGKNQAQPILSTARNFLFSLPGVMILGLIMTGNIIRHGSPQMDADGITLALISGAIASGMGYILWYLTVRRITTTVASISQLTVPILAAIGGIIFLNETLNLRLVVASIMIISGILLTILSKRPPESPVQGTKIR
jgi:drug/metabolite transporter (DMT)-like permease